MPEACLAATGGGRPGFPGREPGGVSGRNGGGGCLKRTTPAFEAMVSEAEHRPDPKRRPAFPRVTPGAGPQRQSESRCSTEQRKQGVTETDGGGAGGGGTLSREVGRGRGGPSEEPPGSHNHALTRTPTRMPAPLAADSRPKPPIWHPSRLQRGVTAAAGPQRRGVSPMEPARPRPARGGSGSPGHGAARGAGRSQTASS